ncbi:hypothetical protein ABZS81_16650 [Streptomyces sp. NPDC005318]|uniref:hypothetical protein n=1 Tax=Streptomyces sp. NPDC005318 TaxID=3157031 RepID=UPI0033BBCDF7
MLDLTTTIDPQHLSPELRKAIAQRDKAYDAAIEFETDNHEILSDDWLVIAEAADLKAAIIAVDAGDDPMNLPSEIDKVRSLRPKVRAIHGKLEREFRAADAKVVALYRRAALPLATDAIQRMDDAVKAAEAAYGAFLGAAGLAGGAMQEVRHLRDWANGGRTNAPGGPGNPVLANGYAPAALDRMEALREAASTFGDAFVPAKRVRVSTVNGAEIVLDEERAKAIVGSNSDPKVKILGPADAE